MNGGKALILCIVLLLFSVLAFSLTFSLGDTFGGAPSLSSSIMATEGYRNIKFPKAPNATKTGLYQTYNRECKRGLKRCRIVQPNGNDYYFCADSCIAQPENLIGEEIKDPTWFQRFAN